MNSKDQREDQQNSRSSYRWITCRGHGKRTEALRRLGDEGEDATVVESGSGGAADRQGGGGVIMQSRPPPRAKRRCRIIGRGMPV
jgi:hypothetical protein